MLEKQKIEERNALNDKLKTAANLRDENIKRILDRLREHVSQSMYAYVACRSDVLDVHFKLIIDFVLMSFYPCLIGAPHGVVVLVDGWGFELLKTF